MVRRLFSEYGREAGDFVAAIEVGDPIAHRFDCARYIAAEDIRIRLYNESQGLDLPVHLVSVSEYYSDSKIGTHRD